MRSCEYGGTLYFTSRGAARAAVADYLYAGGGNGDAEVAAMDPASAAEQMASDGWPVPEGLSAAELAVLVAEAIRGARAAVKAGAKETFVMEADARATSPEILSACFDAGGSYDGAARVWEAPSDDEARAIWSRVTVDGQLPSTEFYWGSAGSQWARQFGLE